MPDFERTVIVPVGSDQAFQYLSNPANLPRPFAQGRCILQVVGISAASGVMDFTTRKP